MINPKSLLSNKWLRISGIIIIIYILVSQDKRSSSVTKDLTAENIKKAIHSIKEAKSKVDQSDQKK